jgi:hypothetical protein
LPEGSTGYCATCHIALTKINAVWAVTPVPQLP